MGLAFWFRFWVQVQCFRPCDRDQHALTQVHHPCHLTNPTNWVHLMANNSSSAFASDGKTNIVLLNFGNGRGCVLFASWGKIKYMVLYGRIRTGLGRWFSKILRIRTGSDSTFADQNWTRTEKFHSPLISGKKQPKHVEKMLKIWKKFRSEA